MAPLLVETVATHRLGPKLNRRRTPTPKKLSSKSKFELHAKVRARWRASDLQAVALGHLNIKTGRRDPSTVKPWQDAAVTDRTARSALAQKGEKRDQAQVNSIAL